jgi:hypothetical protein
MFGPSLVDLVVIVGLLAIVAASRRAGAQPEAPLLVLRRFKVSEAPPDGVFVDISGRPSGVLSWLLTVLRLDDETRLQVSATHISLKHASLRGQLETFVPLGQVGSTRCGFRRPLGMLVLSVLAALMSLVAFLYSRLAAGRNSQHVVILAFIGLVLAAIFLIAYYLMKQMVIAVGDNTARGYWGVAIMPSVIEGATVDSTRLLRAAELINRKILEAQLAPSSVAPKIPSPGGSPLRVVADPQRHSQACPGCGAALEAGGQFCDACGRALRGTPA